MRLVFKQWILDQIKKGMASKNKPQKDPVIMIPQVKKKKLKHRLMPYLIIDDSLARPTQQQEALMEKWFDHAIRSCVVQVRSTEVHTDLDLKKD